MVMTISEAARSKGITRNAVWLAIKHSVFSARKTSGGIWLIEEDTKWQEYKPRRNKAGHPNTERDIVREDI